MEMCNNIEYDVEEHKWSIFVDTFELVHHLKQLIKTLYDYEVVNFTVFASTDPDKEDKRVDYKDVKDISIKGDEDDDDFDIVITHKDGVFSFKQEFPQVPTRFFFYDRDSLYDFSEMITSTEEYEAVYMLFRSYIGGMHRIRFTKEMRSDE